MTAENFIKAEIVQFAFNEAGRSGDYNQMVAVACVLQNRRRRGWHNGDWRQIILHAKETSALEPRANEWVDMANPMVRKFMQTVDDIYAGLFADDLTGEQPAEPGKPRKWGGLYYVDAMWNEYGAMRPWFQEKILDDKDNHPRVAQVGMLYIFS